jgi:hypothetical protein
MNFIERLLGFAPDDGDGSVWILWLIVLVLLVVTVTYFRIQKRRQR